MNFESRIHNARERFVPNPETKFKDMSRRIHRETQTSLFVVSMDSVA